MKALINQKLGLGDILFSIPIANELLKEYEEIIWPVCNHYLWIADYFPNISFVSSDDYDWLFGFGDDIYKTKPEASELDVTIYVVATKEEIKIINLKYANLDHRNETCMTDKYKLVGLDLNLWKTLSWKRNTKKETELYQKLNPNASRPWLHDRPYNLINRNSEYPPKKTDDINVDNGLLNIDMGLLPGYTLLDWALLIEKATNIYTVSTSVNFIVEAVGNEDQRWFVYPRSGDPQLHCMNFLSNNWEYVL